MTLRDEAEALAILLECGFTKVKEAVDWADAHIMRFEHPPYPLIEISMSMVTSGANVVYLLRSLPDEANIPEVSRYAITLIASAFESGNATLKKVTSALYQMFLDGYVPDNKAITQMSRLDDAFDLASDGTSGTVEEVDREVRQFLGQYVR